MTNPDMTASDPLWYYEIQALDAWHVRTSAYEAKNREAHNGRRAIRAATLVAEEHKGCTLRQLQDIYGTKPEPAPEVTPDVTLTGNAQAGNPEVIPEPPSPTALPHEYIEWLEFRKQTLTDIEEQIAVDDLIVGIKWMTAILTRAIDPNVT